MAQTLEMARRKVFRARTIHSLSTTAASSEEESHETDSDVGEGLPPKSKTAPLLTSPEFESELTVRNTFLDFRLAPIERSPSLEDFLPLRQTHSAPGSEAGDTDSDDGSPHVKIAAPASQALAAGRASSRSFALTLPPLPREPAPSTPPPAHGPKHPAAPPALRPARRTVLFPPPGLHTAPPRKDEGTRRPVLQLAAMLEEPKQSAPVAPSVGSLGHGLGQCKPCAFVWKGPGCGNGANCKFCHLCEPGEKQRRQKEKREFFKALRKSGANVGQVLSAGLR